MFDALYIGATGMRGQQMQIDAIAQNVANLNTVGYRRNVVSFSEVAAAFAGANSTGALTQLDASTAARMMDATRVLGAGAMPNTVLSMVGGELRQTGNPFHVAIDGAGFFEVLRNDDTLAYTRAGEFRVNADGLLSASDGSPLANRIAIPSDAHDLQITTDGRVLALLGDDTNSRELGRIDLIGFPNAMSLKSIGDNLYVATREAGQPQTGAPGEAGLGALKQGFVENSNVQMSDELVNLMLAQRAFELNSKIIQAADQMLGIANGLYR